MGDMLTISDKESILDCKTIIIGGKMDSPFSIICEFQREDLNDNSQRKELFEKIRSKCINKNVWALLGKNKSNNYICLQVGSSTSIIDKIILDLKCMLPFDKKKDTKHWSSKFHKNVLDVEYGKDAKCQKYNHMFEHFTDFCIITVDSDKYLEDVDVKDFNKDNYAEVMFACETKARYWNPNSFKKEYQIMEELGF